MNKIYFAGIDTALVNMGVAVISLDTKTNRIKIENAVNTAKPGKEFLKKHHLEQQHKIFKKTKADFIKTSWGATAVEAVLGDFPKPAFIVAEGPAISKLNSRALTAIGASHGAVQTFLYRNGFSFGIAVPNIIKAFATGNGKAEKEDMLAFSNAIDTDFNTSDHNIADSVCMAFLALCFHLYRLGADRLEPSFYENDVFQSKSQSKKVLSEVKRLTTSVPIHHTLAGILAQAPALADKRLEILLRFYLKEERDWHIGHTDGVRICRQRPQKREPRRPERKRSQRQSKPRQKKL